MTVDSPSSPLRARIHALLAVVICSLALTGCWNVVGQRLDQDPPAMLQTAMEANERGDHRAARALLTRLVEEHGESPEANQARRILETLGPNQGLLRPAARE